MRDFLFSNIATIHGLANVPDDPDLAITTGARLCGDLLQPLQATFGRIAIRSAYRSAAVNALGNRLGDNCATNAGLHIWDARDTEGLCGTMACIVVSGVWDRFHGTGEWRKIAWWIHDHLPYSRLQFFPKLFAFNIAWHEAPRRRIVSYAAPKGVLTKAGMANHTGSLEEKWRDLFGPPAEAQSPPGLIARPAVDDRVDDAERAPGPPQEAGPRRRRLPYHRT